MVAMSPEDFEEAVGDALDSIPDHLARQIENVAILIEEDSAAGNLLGLYEGIPLTARDSNWAGVLPDRITIYRRPLMAMCRDRNHLVEQIRVTVLHEVGHYFGISDARLHELGWG